MSKLTDLPLSEAIRAALACPDCQGSLSPRNPDPGPVQSGVVNQGQKAYCMSCALDYPRTPSGSVDLRLKRARSRMLEFPLGTPPLEEDGLDCQPLDLNPAPEVDLSAVRIPHHLTREMISWFPKPRARGALALDLGCGDVIHREVIEAAGFEYAGLDYDSPHAPILGDAHALPFRDGAFEFILSVAVLEHVRWPFVMAREAHRVLKAGGVFIGTVAFLEPFHQNSHYHHTHLGTINTLRYGGFTLERVAPSEEWSVLLAQASMGLFPKLPRAAARALVWPLELLQRVLWRAGTRLNPDSRRRSRTRNTTGAFAFVTKKERA